MEALKPKEEPTSKFKEDLTDLCTSGWQCKHSHKSECEKILPQLYTYVVHSIFPIRYIEYRIVVGDVGEDLSGGRWSVRWGLQI